MSPGAIVDLVVEPDYFQFYARRAGASWASDQVPDDGYRAHLWSDGSFVYIGTARKFGTTSVRVQLFAEEPPVAEGPPWQHVAEVSLEPGGDLEISSWDGDDPVGTLSLPGGPLRLRAKWAGLVAGRFEGLDENGESGEHLEVDVWPARVAEPRVVRWWDPWTRGVHG
jgi:hypothetical protein